ncbi:MAG: fumarylacetoacetate hydrolase family protein [Burkholderiales bacterium]|nr:fumarylacetoacetate hydrolase family protein [Burkholderiales bacterium]
MKAIQFLDGRQQSVSNIYCVGRNYAAHAAELGNAVEQEPFVFLKPTSSLRGEGEPLQLPSFSTDVHFECELVLMIGKAAKHVPVEAALSHVLGYGIGLDLTARDLQAVAKEKGLPWTLSKGFDGAACVSQFIPASAIPDPSVTHFSLDIDGERRQTGDARLMVHGIPALIAYLSSRYTLLEGDLIFTGTPQGVGPLKSGQHLVLDLAGFVQARFNVA